MNTATLRLVRLPTRASLSAAHDRAPDAHRELVIVAIHPHGDQATVMGWGECSALNQPTYTAEWAAGAFDLLVSGRRPGGAEPMAAAALEMAWLDADLRRQGQSLAQRLGTDGLDARAGAVVGLGPIAEVLAQVEGLVDSGYSRVKCKIEPDHAIEPIRSVRSRFPDLEVQVDANGSLSADDIGVLRELAELGVSAVEQPFAVGDDVAAARLVAETTLTVLADESATSVEDISKIGASRTATGVVIKPPRLGGLRASMEAIDAAQRAGLRCSIGGMLECGLGRHLLAALAPHPAFDVVGDLSPARRWLADDPFSDINLRDGRVAAPATVGVAGDPDVELLDAHTVKRAVIALEPT